MGNITQWKSENKMSKEPRVIAGGEALYRNLLSQGYKDDSPDLKYGRQYSSMSKEGESIIFLHIPAVDDRELFPKIKGEYPEMSHQVFEVKPSPPFEHFIDSERYFDTGKTTVCILKLKNGFEATGTSSVVDPADFDETIGRRIARRKALEAIWELEGYRRQCEA